MQDNQLDSPQSSGFLHTARQLCSSSLSHKNTNYLHATLARQTTARNYNFSLRPYLKTLYSTKGNIFHTIEDVGYSPPFSVRFNNVRNEGKFLAMVDEEGWIDIVNTKLDSSDPCNMVGIRNRWNAHQDAIFDMCWSLDDRDVVTVSGDQTAKVWDLQTNHLKSTFSSHSCSIKSISNNPFDPHIYITAGRDGHIMVWDTRCTSSVLALNTYKPVDAINYAHAMNPPRKRKRDSSKFEPLIRVSNQSVSCVRYLNSVPNIIVSTGTADGLLKLWDMRYHGFHSNKEYPSPLATSDLIDTWKRPHGYTSITMDPTQSFIYLSCTDNNIYQFNTINISKPQTQYSAKSYLCSNFYIQTTISPDGKFIASGSKDSNIHVWETEGRRADWTSDGKKEILQKPSFMLKGHRSEVTGVDWNKQNLGQLASCSDDGTVRVWNVTQQDGGLPKDSDEVIYRHLRSTVEESEPAPIKLPTSVPIQRFKRFHQNTISASAGILSTVSNKENASTTSKAHDTSDVPALLPPCTSGEEIRPESLNKRKDISMISGSKKTISFTRPDDNASSSTSANVGSPVIPPPPKEPEKVTKKYTKTLLDFFQRIEK